MKTKKIAELAFHESTSEPEAIAAFLALRRVKGGLAELKDELSESKPTASAAEHVSSWKISGPDTYIGRATYLGCVFARQMDGKCHIKENDKGMFGKRKYTITLRYSTTYSSIRVEKSFEDLLGRGGNS